MRAGFPGREAAGNNRGSPHEVAGAFPRSCPERKRTEHGGASKPPVSRPRRGPRPPHLSADWAPGIGQAAPPATPEGRRLSGIGASTLPGPGEGSLCPGGVEAPQRPAAPSDRVASGSRASETPGRRSFAQTGRRRTRVPGLEAGRRVGGGAAKGSARSFRRAEIRAGCAVTGRLFSCLGRESGQKGGGSGLGGKGRERGKGLLAAVEGPSVVQQGSRVG